MIHFNFLGISINQIATYRAMKILTSYTQHEGGLGGVEITHNCFFPKILESGGILTLKIQLALIRLKRKATRQTR